MHWIVLMWVARHARTTGAIDGTRWRLLGVGGLVLRGEWIVDWRIGGVHHVVWGRTRVRLQGEL